MLLEWNIRPAYWHCISSSSPRAGRRDSVRIFTTDKCLLRTTGPVRRPVSEHILPEKNTLIKHQMNNNSQQSSDRGRDAGNTGKSHNTRAARDRIKKQHRHTNNHTKKRRQFTSRTLSTETINYITLSIYRCNGVC